MSEEYSSYVTVKGPDRCVKAFKRAYTPKPDPKRQPLKFELDMKYGRWAEKNAGCQTVKSDRIWSEGVIDYNALSADPFRSAFHSRIHAEGKGFMTYDIDDKFGVVMNWLIEASKVFASLTFDVITDDGSGTDWIHRETVGMGNWYYQVHKPKLAATIPLNLKITPAPAGLDGASLNRTAVRPPKPWLVYYALGSEEEREWRFSDLMFSRDDVAEFGNSFSDDQFFGRMCSRKGVLYFDVIWKDIVANTQWGDYGPYDIAWLGSLWDLADSDELFCQRVRRTFRNNDDGSPVNGGEEKKFWEFLS